MFSLNKNFQRFIWIVGSIVALFLAGYIYSTFFRRTPSSNSSGLLVAGLLLGAAIMFLVWRLNSSGSKTVTKESSHTVVESIRKVFKIVFAEGHFNELYNFEETKKLFGFIPSTKRALVVIKAKVLVGYDFEKCVWEIDEINQKIKMIAFPEPEIISIEPDYLYYNFEDRKSVV